jgi:hypothetical protein
VYSVDRIIKVLVHKELEDLESGISFSQISCVYCG